MLLGWLATDLSARNVGLGRVLLVDAITRCVRSEIASFAFLLNANDEPAAAFYERESFIRLPGTPVRFVRRMVDLAALVASIRPPWEGQTQMPPPFLVLKVA
ncbi:N-acetyltransferase [Muricoccus nepalensis]|uniref:GNAT family N-acetyltransferase n=1 Tax=Muricoccus nepalensis TaxID=1854500 RepID=UPI00112D35FE|nr:GNAT family N-acetyltransferase [Roseomonas nepalensis]